MISASYLFVNELRDCFIISVGMTSKQHDFDLQIIIILLFTRSKYHEHTIFHYHNYIANLTVNQNYSI